MINRVEIAEKLFKEGYNCSQSVFAAFCDLYGIDQETALKLSSSFGGGIGRQREVCGAVSGMCMVAGLETGSARKMDQEGKKHNYEVVQNLCREFSGISGSIICRELLGMEKNQNTDAAPQVRTAAYYKARPCVQLVKDAAAIIENTLFSISIEPVITQEQINAVAKLAERIWHEHYDTIIGSAQVDYMIDKFQSEEAMAEQIQKSAYEYYQLVNAGGIAGYFAIHKETDALFLSKIYIEKKYRGRSYAKKVMDYLEHICKAEKLGRIWLTVNRNNLTSISVYESLGFTKAGTQVADIGSGFVMDDYIMEKRLFSL